jgi:hypothetical protein
MGWGIRFVGWLAAGFFIMACGGTSSSGSPDAGGVTTGLGGGGGGGGTDPIAPASQGSATIHFQGPSMDAIASGKLCPPGVHFANAPSSYDSAQFTTGISRAPNVLVDGENGVSFSCKVLPAGDKFSVTADISSPAFDKNGKALSIPTQIELSTIIGAGESGASGSLTVADDQTGGATYTSGACIFSVQADANADKKLAIGAGKAWGKVTCPSFDDPSAPLSSCTVDFGYFILENCL